MVSVTTPDNAVVSTSYGANTVTVTDQAGKQRKSVSDALGRLKEVYEAPNDANYNYLTSYLYDPLDNLTKVTQGSQPPREFAYDSLKRLTSATNPESGTVSYQYDANANLTQKIDARSIVTTIAYDALNRPTTKTYSDGTANVAYFYDSQSLPTGAPAFDRGYATGRLVATTYGGNSNGTYFGYDALGRPLRSIQQTGTINYQTTANYNLAGAITSMSYPSGRTITNTYDNAGRLTAFTGYLGDGTQRTYATGISYSSFGGMTQEQFGTNTALYHKLHYNVRGQLYDIRASTLSLAQNEFDWNRGAVVLYYGGTGWGQSGASNNGAGGATRYAFSRRYFDGRGAVARSMVYQGSTDGWSTQDLEYDSMGRAYRSSNPYFAAGYSSTPASASSMFSTTSHFDHLGRVTQVTMPRGDNDNTLLTSVYSSFDGIYTTVTDQAGKVRRQKVDALGRVIRLDEPDLNGNLGDVGSPAQPTSYEYDTLDNLIHIAQGAQHRYLKYDSLARLTHERQVEQDAPWTTSDYVAGNNQWSRKIIYNSHSLIQDAYDARQVRTNFVYDDLNRVKEIHYFGANGQPDPATPDAFYWYDSQTLPPGAPTFDRGYSTGRLVAMTYGGTSANPNSTGNYFGYDKVGRVERQRQVTGTTTYTLSYTYNLASRLTSETYPSNRVISYGYEEAGRLSQISEGSTIYANGFAYQPHGGLGSETFGNGMVHSLAYNRRLQPSEVTLKQSAAGVELQRYNYSYGQVNQTDGSVDTTKNNGQIGRIDGFINGAKQWDQRISYDSLGRLSTAGEYRGDTGAQTWQTQYTFDRFGNRFQSGGGNSGLNYVPVVSGDIDANRNRFVSTGATPTTYDPAGNIVTDAKFRNLQYVYDANGRQTAAKLLDNSPLQNSVYDCAGQRVQTIAGGVTRTMVYDIFGQNVADYSNGALERENIYRGGQLFLTWGAMPTPPLNPFTFTDDPLVAGSTVVKAVHLNELRAAVNQARGHAGLSAATWTDDPAQGTVTTIKAVHITELRARLDEARAALGLAAASYTDPTLTVGSTTVKAVHVQELRARTNEALTAPGPAGGTPVLTYLLTDVQGSTRAAMNNNGVGSSTVIARHDFFPFGEEIGSGTGMRTSGQRYGVVNPNRWKYGLTERDNITGLDHTGWRKYENLSGRWTRPDPYKGSMVFSNPQSFNRYTYVQNDPVNFVDPSGLDPASAARRLLGNPSCRALFGNTDPFNLLNSIVRKNRLWVSSIYPRRGYYSNDRSARFLSFARWTRFGTRLAVTIDATYDAPIGQMRNPFIFLSRSFVAEAQRGGDMAHLYGPQSLGIVMVHELLHAAGRIPDDSEGTPGENYQSHLNSLLVKLFCVTLPNQPLSTTTPALNNTPIMRQPIGGGGPGGPTFIGGGGYPGWWYSMWSFLAWVNSIPVGGYGEVIGYDIDDPEKPGHEAH